MKQKTLTKRESIGLIIIGFVLLAGIALIVIGYLLEASHEQDYDSFTMAFKVAGIILSSLSLFSLIIVGTGFASYAGDEVGEAVTAEVKKLLEVKG